MKDFRSDLAFLKTRLAQFESNIQNNPDSTGGDLHLLVATKIRRLLCEYRLETLGMPDQVEKKWAPLLVGWLRTKNQTRAIVVLYFITHIFFTHTHVFIESHNFHITYDFFTHSILLHRHHHHHHLLLLLFFPVIYIS
jgi:hypothetical protein